MTLTTCGRRIGWRWPSTGTPGRYGLARPSDLCHPAFSVRFFYTILMPHHPITVGCFLFAVSTVWHDPPSHYSWPYPTHPEDIPPLSTPVLPRLPPDPSSTALHLVFQHHVLATPCTAFCRTGRNTRMTCQRCLVHYADPASLAHTTVFAHLALEV